MSMNKSQTMEAFQKFVVWRRSHNGTNECVAYLRRHYESMKDILDFIGDKNRTSGISPKGYVNYRNKKYPNASVQVANYDNNLGTLLSMLSERTLTGHSAYETCCHYEDSLETTSQKHLFRLLLGKNVDCRLSSGILRAVSGKQKWPCSLGYPLDKANKDFEHKCVNYLVSRKLDGVRVTYYRGKFYSRQRNQLVALDSLIHHFETEYTLDGEMCIVNPKTNEEDFAAAVSYVRRKKPIPLVFPNGFILRFCVFDILTNDEFMGREISPILSERMKRTVRGSVVSIVRQYPYSELGRMEDRSKENGWEGLILRNNVPYIGKRTKDILKVKRFHREEYRVINQRLTTKLIGSKRISVLGSVDIVHGGKTVQVGSGFDDDERILYAKKPLVGNVIAVQYFEETPDGSLRFPTFKTNYGVDRQV